jgi:hypothetical protein
MKPVAPGMVLLELPTAAFCCIEENSVLPQVQYTEAVSFKPTGGCKPLEKAVGQSEHKLQCLLQARSIMQYCNASPVYRNSR